MSIKKLLFEKKVNTLGFLALVMTLSILAVFVAFSVYLFVGGFIAFVEPPIELLFWLIIVAISVVIAIGFLWGSFVSKVTSEVGAIVDFLSEGESHARPIEIRNFRVYEFLKIAQNINDMLSQIAQKNRELNELNGSLEQKIDEKTEALKQKNRELELAKKQVERALASRDKFIKDSIHEVNTPLAVIGANIELMRLTGQESRHLVKIEAASKIITNIYEDLSYFIKKDRFVSKKEVLSLTTFVSERIEYFKEALFGANLSLLFDGREQYFISFDKTQLQRFVDNNIYNAIKYSKEKSEIRVSVFSDAKGKIVFEVVNYALYPPDMKVVFDRFYRGNDARGGFGIGLNLVHQIAAQNGVKICCAALDDGRVWFSYAFKDYFEDAFSSHGF